MVEMGKAASPEIYPPIYPSAREFPSYDQLDVVVSRLPILYEQQTYARHLVDYLAIMGNILIDKNGDATLPLNFRPAEIKTVTRQLSKLAKRADALADKIDRRGGLSRARHQLALLIEDFRSPTLSSLSQAPPVVVEGRQILADTWYLQNGFVTLLQGSKTLNSSELRFWAQVAKSAMKADINTREVGRPENRLFHNVAAELARKYQILTGRDPTFSTASGGEDEGEVSGPFLEFAREIFAILGINHDALCYASQAAFKLRGRGRKK